MMKHGYCEISLRTILRWKATNAYIFIFDIIKALKLHVQTLAMQSQFFTRQNFLYIGENVDVILELLFKT